MSSVEWLNNREVRAREFVMRARTRSDGLNVGDLQMALKEVVSHPEEATLGDARILSRALDVLTIGEYEILANDLARQLEHVSQRLRARVHALDQSGVDILGQAEAGVAYAGLDVILGILAAAMEWVPKAPEPDRVFSV